MSGFDLCLPCSINQRLTVVQHRSRQTRPALSLPILSFIARIFALAALLAGWPAIAGASPPAAELVQAELIAEPAAIKAGEPFWVGVRLRIKDHWHVYWRNPGDSGEAPTIAWQLPPGFAAGPIAWPTPQRIPVAHLANFGYEGETMLLARITPSPTLDASVPVALKADVTWLVCEKECIPGETSLTLALPVAGPGSAAAPDAATTAAFDAARRALPQPSPWAARMQLAPDQVTLVVDTKGLDTGAVRSAFFFPNAETLVRHAAPQQLTVTRDGLVLRLERSALSTAAPADAGGVLVVEEAIGTTTAKQAFELANVAVGQGAAPHATASMTAVLQAALLALIGGVILNLMPCVFPVLSIKVLALVEQAARIAHRGATARARLYGWRAGGVHRFGRRAAGRARGRRRGRMGLPAAVARCRGAAGLPVARHGLEPIGRLSSGIVAAGPGARA